MKHKSFTFTFNNKYRLFAMQTDMATSVTNLKAFAAIKFTCGTAHTHRINQ